MLILKYSTKLDITTIAMINSGGMRAKSLGNDITMEDLLNVFPYENSIDVMELKGGAIRKVMEKSAKLLSPEKPNTGGGFIQVSGKLKKCINFFIFQGFGKNILEDIVDDSVDNLIEYIDRNYLDKPIDVIRSL